mmetsp:Transcript_55382/g.108409  ORF Transcript_55382/g.108409 Transcript_55382/m.108409 type:complete len:203 (+) Transcript_55382:531-1139(+)
MHPHKHLFVKQRRLQKGKQKPLIRPESSGGSHTAKQTHEPLPISLTCRLSLSVCLFVFPCWSHASCNHMMLVTLLPLSLSTLFKIPARTFPGPSSYPDSNPFSRRNLIEFSQRTGEVTCFARSVLISSGSLWACASTFEITGSRGAFTSTPFKNSESSSTAGAMYCVWNAPATGILMQSLALNSGLAICNTASHASLCPEVT